LFKENLKVFLFYLHDSAIWVTAGNTWVKEQTDFSRAWSSNLGMGGRGYFGSLLLGRQVPTLQVSLAATITTIFSWPLIIRVTPSTTGLFLRENKLP
jgi:hypothetical protein